MLMEIQKQLPAAQSAETSGTLVFMKIPLLAVTIAVAVVNGKLQAGIQGTASIPAAEEEEQMQVVKNIFAEIPAQLPQELTQRVAAGSHVVIERIVSRGHASPPGFWYDQPRSEWVLLLSGRAGLRFKDRRQRIVMGPGDHIEIPAHCRHRVEWTDPHADTVWLAVFFDAQSEPGPESSTKKDFRHEHE